MVCPNCGQESAEGAKFCTKCGCQFSSAASKPNLDVFILLFGLIILITFLLQFLIEKTVPDWYEGGISQKIIYSLAIIRDLAAFLPVVCIKNIALKIICGVSILIPTIFWIYDTITAVLR